MRAITEDDAIRILQSADEVNLDTVKKFRAACQEIDTFTVSKLRPMSDAPEHDPCFVVHRDEPTKLVWAYRGYDNSKMWDLFCSPKVVREDELIGWVQKPTYKPE